MKQPDQLKDRLRRAYRALGYVLTALSVYFLVYCFRRLPLQDLANLDRTALVVWGVALSIYYALSFSLLSAGWLILLRHFDGSMPPKVDWRTVLPLYNKANLMKYLPGNVMEFVARNLLAREHGLKHQDIAAASLIETVMILLVACVLSVVFAYEELHRLLGGARFHVIGAGGAVVVLALLFAPSSIKAKVRPLLNARLVRALLQAGGLHVLVFVNLGLSMAWIYSAILHVPLEAIDYVRILSALTLAWVAGFVVPGAPGGIGVKEAVLITALGGVYGMDATVLAGVIHRVVSIAGDVLAYLLGYALDIRKSVS